MAILGSQVREQLRQRFEERLDQPVQLTIYLKPGSGRLILPAGVGCPTCEDARGMAEELVSMAPEKLSLETVDVTRLDQVPVDDVPTLRIGEPGAEARIAFQGLPSGFEFATVVDAIERVSRSEPGLADASMRQLERLEEPVELMVFATPT